MNKYLKFLYVVLLLSASAFTLQAQTIKPVPQTVTASIRGMSVVNDRVAWISGSKGHIAITTDGGENWTWQQVKGYEKADFRDVQAFSEKEAVIIASGTPALVLKTTDGGLNWKLVFQNNDAAYFLDAMDFADSKHGYIMGDPINNKFLMLETKDGGDSWAQMTNSPEAIPGEAAFAASGTCMRVQQGHIVIATGGTVSRYIYSPVKNIKWQYVNTPLSQNKSSKGAFGLTKYKNKVIVVGGDYEVLTKPDSVAAVLVGQNKFNLSAKMPGGFQSCVEHIKGDTFVATGTSGTNVTNNGGKTWTQIDSTSFNVCLRSASGKLILLAGDKGKIGILKF
ncbi:oxidoreductase [Mucilaginibacter sp. JRF]|uniref:WD40/YVTN/BNR-like repeat-containing protein n=1 Tax=Mucilaginibacter sp. JRF TaxID=2780088 RepID=UPI00187E7BF1|nr:YCF48-related protein [Mucilaginibacter sp. JRF]MBE9584222.1 oxidoreductase [Mucilaginibacter sp. JRF]